MSKVSKFPFLYYLSSFSSTHWFVRLADHHKRKMRRGPEPIHLESIIAYVFPHRMSSKSSFHNHVIALPANVPVNDIDYFIYTVSQKSVPQNSWR